MQLVLGAVFIALALRLIAWKNFRRARTVWAPIMFLAFGVETLASAGGPEWHTLVEAAQLAVIACGLWGFLATRNPAGTPRDTRRLALRVLGLAIVVVGGGLAAIAPQQRSSDLLMWCGGLTVVAGASLWLLARERSPQL